MQHRLVSEIELPLAPAGVFEFFADAANLEQITPPELQFSILTTLPIEMRAGALIDYRLRLFGVPILWHTQIAEWDPPAQFVDQQLRGPYSVWIHRHRFLPRPGGTLMLDEVRYALPLAPLGELAHLPVRFELRRIFSFRAKAIARLLGEKRSAEAGYQR